MTSNSRIAAASFLFLLLTLPSMAQAQNLPQDRSLISISNAMALDVGRLYRFSTWPDNPPLPPAVLLQNPYLQAEAGDLSTNLFYSPSLDSFLWDDRELVAAQMLAAAATIENQLMFEQEQLGLELGLQGPYGTNDFYLEPVSVVSNLFNALLHNTTNGSTYLITSTEAIDPVTNSVWLVEGSLQGGTNDASPFALGIALRTNSSLFISAQACDECATNTLPLWWQLAYFGVTGVDPNGDYDCDGVTNLLEFLNSTDPNKIVFSLSVTNEYVATTAVPVQVSIASGVPSYLAVLLNDDSPANASWQPFTPTSLSVELPTNGTYVITVGLCGLATNAAQSWQSLTVIRDTTPLTLGLTNLSALSGSRPFIDPAGYASRALSALNWTLIDATGATNTGNGMVVAQDWNLSDPWHVTNWLQCVDLPLALGTNWICIQATDWAGSVAETNFSYVFDTNGDTNAPALTVAWPPAGGLVSGESFTVQASTDDDTAAVALQYLDGDGILQTVNGVVERGGKVWARDVPLAAGTNQVSVLTTDAAGNVSTNSLTVVGSGTEFTIDSLSADDLKFGYATVSGYLDDPNGTATVTVNGVVAENVYGCWTATNVAIPPGGIVTLQATAQWSNGTSLYTMLTQERGPIVFTQTYDYKLDYTSDGGSTNTWESHHFELHWARGVGGTNVESSWRLNGDGTVSSNYYVAVWPPDNGYWPSLRAQTWTASYWNGVLTNSLAWTADHPSVEWMEKSSSAGSRPDLENENWSEASGREVRLFTGGTAERQSQGLFDLSASLTCESLVPPNISAWLEQYPHPEFQPFLFTETTPVAVPPQDITLGAEGNLGSDGHRFKVESSGNELIITPIAPVTSYFGDLPEATKYTPQILFNGVDVSDKATSVWVGQHINPSFQFDSDPPEPVTNYFWTVPGQRVAYFRITFSSGTNIPLTRLANSDVSYYWVDAVPTAPVKCTVKIMGLELSAQTTFNVLKPDADWNGITNGIVAVVAGYLEDGTPPFATAGMQFIFTNLNLRGYSGNYEMSCAQIASINASWSGLDIAGQPLTTNLASQGIDSAELWKYETFGEIKHGVTQDSPGVVTYVKPVDPLLHFSRITAATCTDSFTHYLYFQPDPSGDSIPVALKQITWTVSLRSTNSPNSLSADTVDTSATSRSVLSTNVPVAGDREWTSRATPPGGRP